MTSREFCYWLQGFFEINGEDPVALTSAQSSMIRRHLHMVFIHEIDAAVGPKESSQLQQAHGLSAGQGSTAGWAARC